MGGITTTIINKVKYIGIASLTIAILSVIILNLISSYSSSNTNSNAEPVSNSNANVSALADNEASANALDPTSVSISISSHSATGDTNDPNLSLSIPQGGGLVAGRHTVSVSVGSEIDSYTAYLNSAVDNKALVNDEDSSRAINASSDGTSYEMPGLGIRNNTWGVALPDRFAGYVDADKYESLITNPVKSNVSSDYTDSNYPIAGIASPNNLDDSYSIGEVKYVDGGGATALPSVYYVVRVDNPSTMLAGDYTTNVIYTVVAELKAPSIDSVSPNPIRTGTTNKITLRGNNLDIVSKVTIDDRGTIRDCTSLTHTSSAKLTCTLPAISNAGNYTITAETAGGQTATTQIRAIPPVPVISSVSPFTTEIGSSGTTLTISGENFIDVQYVYVDFNGDGVMDSGEQCQSLVVVSDTQLSCIAPEYSTTGVYDLMVVAAGGVSEPIRYSYVEPETTVTRVEPSVVYTNQYGDQIEFSIYGSNLRNCREVILSDSYSNTESCYVRSVGISSVECVATWTFQNVGSISATFYDNAGEVMYETKTFTQNSR